VPLWQSYRSITQPYGGARFLGACPASVAGFACTTVAQWLEWWSRAHMADHLAVSLFKPVDTHIDRLVKLSARPQAIEAYPLALPAAPPHRAGSYIFSRCARPDIPACTRLSKAKYHHTCHRSPYFWRSCSTRPASMVDQRAVILPITNNVL
jgi:hypothetical protein